MLTATIPTPIMVTGPGVIGVVDGVTMVIGVVVTGAMVTGVMVDGVIMDTEVVTVDMVIADKYIYL